MSSAGGVGAATPSFDEAAMRAAEERYVLRLFVTGMTPRSTEAVRSIRKLCEARLAGRYDLEVVDVYQHPTAARDEQIVAIPTLLKKRPLPARMLVGDMSDTQRVLSALNLELS